MTNLFRKKIILLISLFTMTLSSCQVFRLFFSKEDEVSIKKRNLDAGECYRLKQNYPLTLNKINHGQKLELKDIQNMTKAGVSDEGIMAQIKTSKSVFYLTSKDIEELRQEGVSERVIQFMHETEEMH